MKLKDISNLNSGVLLHEGITNESYLINGKYVYRHKSKNIDPFSNPENEFKILEIVKDFNFVENVIDYDISSGKKLSLFIDKTSRLSLKPSKNELSLVHDVIETLHSSKKLANNNFDPFERIEFYKQNVTSEINDKFEKEIIKAAKHLYEKYPLVLSHNDLVKGNMLFKEDKLYLLDFEYAGNNIALFDICSFVSENEIDNDAKEYFLSLFQNINKKDVELMISLENILWYYWAKYLYKETNRQIFLTIAEDKLAKINNI